MGASTFATSIPGLAAYLNNVMDYLPGEAGRLAIDPAQVTALQDLYGPVGTAGTYLYCKDKWDKGGKRKPSIVTTELKTASDKIKAKLTEIYDDIPAGKWNDMDRQVFNRKTGLPHTVSHHTTRIQEECVLDIKALRAGMFTCSARTSNDTKKHDIPVGADMIEIRFAVVAGKFEVPADLASKIRKTCTGAEDGTTKEIFRKALFSLNISPELAGYELHVWGRWINSVHPGLAGNWSERHIVMIMA
jgi:hypothetical protein